MHKILRFQPCNGFKSPVNIKFFQDFVKQLVLLTKRCFTSNRSSLFLAFIVCTPAFADFEDLDVGARSTGVAGAAVAWPLGAESVFQNPACILFEPQSMDAFASYANPFHIPELHLGGVALQYSAKRYAVGGAVQYFGNRIYRENQFLLTGALRAAKRFVVGANVRYAALTISGYGQSGALLFDVGGLLRLHPGVAFGFAIKNANYAVIGRAREPMPQILSTGVSVRAAPRLLLNVDLYKDARFPVDARFGAEFSPFSVLSLRVGTATEPSRVCAGFSLKFVHFRIDYAFKSHDDLGASHLFSFNFF